MRTSGDLALSDGVMGNKPHKTEGGAIENMVERRNAQKYGSCLNGKEFTYIFMR